MFTRKLAICYGLATLTLLMFVASSLTFAQQRTSKAAAARLPSPEKIINDYVRALGGKRRLAGVKDATYLWSAESGKTSGVNERAKLQMKAPGSFRWKLDNISPEVLAGTVTEFAATPRSAWSLLRIQAKTVAEGAPISSNAAATRTGDAMFILPQLRTLTGTEAGVARLQAAIFASRLLNLKKQNFLARTLAAETFEGEATYVVEISSRDGARLRLYFNRETKLLRRFLSEAENKTFAMRFGDYRAEGGILEPHEVAFENNGRESLRLKLQSVVRNTGISDTAFDPPSERAIDVVALLREVARNQQTLDERVSEYTFTRKQTEREINDRGEIKKEKTIVHEIYPVRGGGRVLKFISENGVPLAGEGLEREGRRVAEEIEKIERENTRRAEEKAKRTAERKQEAARRGNESGAGGDGDDDFGVKEFLRACEFVAPRREFFRDREAIVFDFRPRPGFKPSNRGESLVSKLTGIVWIDPVDKQVMRLEARLTEGFKIGGGLLASVRSGSAFVIEQTRLTDGVWLPRFSQINASTKVFLLAGFRLDATREYGDYKRFSTDTKNYELNAPKDQ